MNIDDKVVEAELSLVVPYSLFVLCPIDELAGLLGCDEWILTAFIKTLNTTNCCCCYCGNIGMNSDTVANIQIQPL